MQRKNVDSLTQNNSTTRKTNTDNIVSSKSTQERITLLDPVKNLTKLCQKSKNATNIGSIANHYFRVDRKQLTFYGKEPFSQLITIQNIGKVPLKLFLNIPKTAFFFIKQDCRNFSLSAGMIKKITISMPKIPQDDSCLDFVFIKTDKNSQKIDLNWNLNKPSTHYESIIDLQKVQTGRNHNATIKFTNTSLNSTKSIKIIKDPLDNIQLHPDHFSIKPQQAIEIELIVSPQKAGVYHHKLIIQEQGQLLKPLQVIYAAIDCVYKIEEQNGMIAKELEFGTLIKGTKKQMSVWAHNSGPRDVQLRMKVKIGKGLRAQSTLQSPQQLGIQSSSTVIDPETKNIKIPAFSRARISMTAYLQAQQRQKQLVQRLARSEGLTAPLKQKLQKQDTVHQQILVCEFVESQKITDNSQPGKITTLVVPMRVCFSLPALKISPSAIALGTIYAESSISSSLTIENLSNSCTLNLQIGKLFNSQCFLNSQILTCKELQVMDIVTRAHNLGQFKGFLDIIVASIYSIKIPIEYQVIAHNHKDKLFQTFHQSVNHEEAIINLTNTISLADRQKHRKKYNVPSFRTGLVKNKSSASLMQQNNNISSTNSIRNSSAGKSKQVSILYRDNANDNVCTPNQRLMSAQTKNYPLFVTKKIDKYMPFQELKQCKKLQKTRNCKDYFPVQLRRQPKNRKQAEQIERQLTPEELKQITISNKVISFGRIFAKSQSQRQWSIINQTQFAIFVQLKDNGSDPRKSNMISSSDFQPQIIPVHGAGRFKIGLLALICGKFQTTLSYSINNVHTFQLLVTAQVELASLSLNKTQLKMNYADEQDILLTESFELRNQGNTITRFSIMQPTDKFKVSPLEGQIKPSQSQLISVVQNQKYFPIIQAGEVQSSKGLKRSGSLSQLQQRILIKVVDGNDISLKVITQAGVADPRCLVKEQRINFGGTIVSKQKAKTFQLKNLSRTLSLFQIINDQCAQFLSFDCIKGRIPPQGNKQITVIYKSSVIHSFNSSFKVMVKGGLIINVPVSAESIAPEVSIIESNFAFGQICCDTAVVRPISIKNNSQIPVQLFLDTRRRERGVQYLFPSFWGANSQPIREGFTFKKAASLSNFAKGNGLQEEIIEKAVLQHGVHHIKIQPKSVYSFSFVFKPSSPGYYQFILPIFLQGFIRNDSLSKAVSCLVIQPRFIIEPSVLSFKKKIINDKDNGCFHPFIEYLTLRNPTNHKLSWKLDVVAANKSHSLSSYSTTSLPNKPALKESSILSQKSCFEIEQKRGQLGPKESVSINVSFSPIEQGLYFHKIPLFIYNQEKGTFQHQAQVRLEGQGKYPSLTFNRRQLILPAVPLGIQAIGLFEVHNEGYETINLKHRFEIADLQGNPYVSKGNLCGENGLPQLSIVFPEGSKLSNNKKQLIVMIKFVSRKVSSFTCKLQIFDDATDCRIYSLPISATADNSLLTTFSYLADSQNIYKFQQVSLDHDKKSKKIQQSVATSIMLKSNDGRNLIDRYHSVYQNLSSQSFQFDCKIVKRWLNQFLRQQKVRQFPTDIAQNSQIFLKLIHRLTGRKQFDGNYQVQIQGVKQLLNGHGTNKLQFYVHIIRLLKQINCLLNHIRPQFLLQKQDFLHYMSQDPGWKLYASYFIKYQEIIHKQAWLILIYQLISQFWCQRQKLQTQSYKIHSNVYSAPQLAVLRWTKSSYQAVNSLQQTKNRFLSFGKDFKDCIAPINCLLRYALPTKQSKLVDGLSKRPITRAEFDDNIKILYQLLEKLNVVPLVYQDQYPYCNDKQIFLLMYQLFQILPQLLPKGPPIIFACELGESATRAIQIKNPSTKTVHYWVKIEGSRDFQAQDKECISIQPKGVFNFLVEFKCRLSVEQVAYLSFLSKQEGQANSGNGTALVFELRSKITGRKSIKTLETITCPLYDSTSSKVLVENPFEESQIANFTVSLIQQNPEYKFKNAQRKNTQNNYLLSQNTQDFKPITQFYCQIDSLKIKRGSAASIQIFFNPVRLGKTKCFLVFHDPAVGQFQYQVSAITEIPRPLQELRIQQSAWVGTRQPIEVVLPMYNSYMLKCEALLQQRYSQKIHRNRQINEQKFKLQLNMDPKITEHIHFPTEVILKGAKKEGTQPQNKLKLDCNFSCVLKDLTLDFILLGDFQREVQDVRRFKVAITILHRPLTQQLIMTTPARKSLVQQIPIQNLTIKDWKFKATIVENQSNSFSLKQGEKCVLKEFIIKKGQVQSINIYFQPKWVLRSSSKIIVHNLTTNEQIILKIKGVAEDPISEDHIHIKAHTEQSTMHTININNPYSQKLIYKVISDIEELQLPPEIALDPQQTASFNIFAISAGGASQVGFIKFVEPEGRFFWYSVTLQSTDKKAREFFVELSTEVGSEVQKYIEFKNPFSKILHFKVQYPRDIGLQASQDFTIAPHGVYQYCIKYQPQRLNQTEVSLKASNREIGIFIYKIRLNARQQIKRKAFHLSVQVGKSGYLEFKLQNPRKQPLKVNYSVSNYALFFVQAPQLLALGENQCKIRFTPSSEGKETCNVRVWGEFFPTRYFEIEGIGIAPYSIQTIQMKSRVGENTLEVVRFKNPNPKNTKQTVRVSLTQNCLGNFKITGCTGSNEWVTEIDQILGIPIQFHPKEKGYFESVMTIQCFHYQWKYLLKGSTNFRQAQRIQEQINTVSKEQIIQRLKINVPDYYEQPPNYFDQIEVQHQNKKMQRLLRSWLKIRLSHPQEDQSAQNVIILLIKFRPKKPIKQLAKLVLSNSKEEGPTLTCNLQLSVLPNQPESTIELQIDAIKTMSFDLNGLGMQATVGAKMSKPNHCEVQRLGDTVRLRFKPTHLLFTRTKYYTDNLIVENQEEQWNYTVRFTLKK